MSDRIVIALALIVVGVVAYRLLLLAQQRTVSRRARSGERVVRATLLVFTSPTCAPCKFQQLPIVNRLMVEWSDKIDVRVIDVTEQPEAAQHYGVWSLPTTIVLKADRAVVAINQGVAHEKKLCEQFERATAGQAVTRQLVTGQSVTG
ncbi:MAG: conjugal transfer protein TraF [Chloroflexi bacterium]|nr:conjugal transfer protein TraF [Chloroflexota bacterium]